MTRILTACILLSVTGCAPGTATLIDEAMESGDWRAVNARLDAEARREEQRAPSCPGGTRAMCVSDFGNVECACVEAETLGYDLGGLVR